MNFPCNLDLDREETNGLEMPAESGASGYTPSTSLSNVAVTLRYIAAQDFPIPRRVSTIIQHISNADVSRRRQCASRARDT